MQLSRALPPPFLAPAWFTAPSPLVQDGARRSIKLFGKWGESPKPRQDGPKTFPPSADDELKKAIRTVVREDDEKPRKRPRQPRRNHDQKAPRSVRKPMNEAAYGFAQRNEVRRRTAGEIAAGEEEGEEQLNVTERRAARQTQEEPEASEETDELIEKNEVIEEEDEVLEEMHEASEEDKELSEKQNEVGEEKDEASKEENTFRGDHASREKQPRSLLEELFPEEAREQKAFGAVPKKHATRSPQSQPRGKRSMFFHKPSPWADAAPPGRHWKYMYEESRGTVKKESYVVLKLNNASKSLIESDFFRLSPKSKHIEDWASGIVKVIPSRFPPTLNALPTYHILFTSLAATKAYQNNITRFHQLARSHVPSSLTGYMPLPAGFTKDGEDVQALVSSFTLIPPSHFRLSMEIQESPFRPNLTRLLEDGGYLKRFGLEQENSKLGRVLVYFDDSAVVNKDDLTTAINEDGKHRRHMFWRFAHDKHKSIVKIENGKVAEADDLELSFGELQLKTKTPSGRKTPPRYVISLKDRAEAHRFVRAWHRRPLPVTRKWNSDEDPPMINAEILW